MEPFDQDNWLLSVMTCRKMTHLYRVVAWHLFKMSDSNGSVPYSITDMSRKIGYVHRSQVQKSLRHLEYVGYVIDLDPDKGIGSWNRDKSKRFKLAIPEGKKNGGVRQGSLAQVHHEHGKIDSSSASYSLAFDSGDG